MGGVGTGCDFAGRLPRPTPLSENSRSEGNAQSLRIPREDIDPPDMPRESSSDSTLRSVLKARLRICSTGSMCSMYGCRGPDSVAHRMETFLTTSGRCG